MPASAYGQIQVTKPKDWQAFERGSSLLWRKILKDDSLHRFGRGGQEQFGLDMYGYRDSDPDRIVGIQCKCKGQDKQATEDELREDFAKALDYEVKLTEYFFTTTAEDHGPLQTLAARLTAEQKALGRSIIVRAWGWGTIEERLQEHDVAHVFLPQEYVEAFAAAAELKALRAAQASASPALVLPSDAPTADSSTADTQIDSEIDRYRDLLLAGKPKSALQLLNTLLASLSAQNSGHIWFRVKANIGHCYLHIGDNEKAETWLTEAVEHAPGDAKASANRVLSMILRGDHQAAFDQALIDLDTDPENEALAAYAIQAAGHLEIEDPISALPEPLRTTDAVVMHHIFNLRAKGDTKWIELSMEGLERSPEDPHFRRYVAEGRIEAITAGQHSKTWRLAPGDREVLIKSAEELERLWAEAKAGEAPERQDNIVLCSNAVVARLLAGDKAQASDLIKDGLSVIPNDPDLLVKSAAVAMEIGDRSLAKELFDRLPSEGAGLLLRVQIAASLADWKYLNSLHQSNAISTVPETDLATVNAIVDSAHAKTLAKKDHVAAEKFLSQKIENSHGVPRALVLLGKMAEDLGIRSLADTAFQGAMSAVTDESHISSRLMVAEYAEQRRDLRAVIKMLDGYIDTSVHSEELDELASAFAYLYPATARGLGFFSGLPEHIRQTEHVAVLEGILHTHRQDPKAAAERFAKAHDLAPEKLRPLLMLLQTLLREKDKAAVAEIIESLVPSAVSGSALERMHLAQFLALFGRKDEAFEVGFEALQSSRNDPKVNLNWIGLGLRNISHLAELSADAVDVGMWVKLISPEGQPNEFTIVDGPNRPSDGLYSKDHSIAGTAIGHRAGESFTVVDSIGRERVWKVEEVRHRYHHAYEDAVEHFNDRFPNENGFWVIKTQGDDIGPVLDLVKRQGERQDQLLEMFTNPLVPMAFMVEAAGGNVISFAETLRAKGLDIDVCDNTYAEIVQNIDAVKRFRGRGAVIDTFTHWTAVGLGAVDILQSVFGRLLVARSTFDQVVALSDEDPIEGTEPAGTAFFHKGQYYYDEMTPERLNARAAAISAREASLNSDFEIMPVHAPEDADRDLFDHINRGAMDPIFVAKEHGVLLLSDDKRYRLLAKSMAVEGVWLQAVFHYARYHGLISKERYALLAADLASLRHASVMIDATDIATVVGQSTPDTRYRLHAISSCIGTKNADQGSHLRALLGAIHQLWVDGPTLDGKYTTGLLIQNAIRFHQDRIAIILPAVEVVLSQYIGGEEYFRNWRVGHFLAEQAS